MLVTKLRRRFAMCIVAANALEDLFDLAEVVGLVNEMVVLDWDTLEVGSDARQAFEGSRSYSALEKAHLRVAARFVTETDFAIPPIAVGLRRMPGIEDRARAYHVGLPRGEDRRCLRGDVRVVHGHRVAETVFDPAQQPAIANARAPHHNRFLLQSERENATIFGVHGEVVGALRRAGYWRDPANEIELRAVPG